MKEIIALAVALSATTAVADEALFAEVEAHAQQCMDAPEPDKQFYYGLNAKLNAFGKKGLYDKADELLSGTAQDCVQRVYNEDFVWSPADDRYLTPEQIEERAAEHAIKQDAAERQAAVLGNELARKAEVAERIYNACVNAGEEAYLNEICLASFEANGLPDWNPPFDIDPDN